MRLYDNSTGHIIVEHDGELMLLDTGAGKTFHDAYLGVRVSELARVLRQPLDGVLGMDRLKNKVLALTRDRVQCNGDVRLHPGAPLDYVNGLPCVEIRINEIRCRALIKTGAAVSYVSDSLISMDKYTRTLDDVHPVHGPFRVRMFANHFSVSDKRYFADVGQMPGAFESLSSIGVDAILGTDLLYRFDVVLDFRRDRLHLLGR